MARTDSESPRLASSSGTWSPSPSPSPPASPKIIDIETLSPEDRIRILEQYAPMRPSELGLPSGTSPISGTGPGKDRKRDAKGKGKEPMVVLSPEELEKLVAKQQAGASPKNSLNNATTMDGESEEEDADEAEDDDDEPALWEDVANAVLWTIPFGFLFCGMCVLLTCLLYSARQVADPALSAGITPCIDNLASGCRPRKSSYACSTFYPVRLSLPFFRPYAYAMFADALRADPCHAQTTQPSCFSTSS